MDSLGEDQQIKEQWDANWLTGDLSGIQHGTQHTINEWRDAWGLIEGSVQQYKINERWGACGLTEV